AKQDGHKEDDVAGAGNGYVAMFDQTGALLKTLISQGLLNSPWGLTLAPAGFGPFGGTLLVGNFGDGTINAFDPVSGKPLGTLADLNGKPIVIPGLWSLNFGSGARSEDTGTLYFTAGIGDGPDNANNLESHGLLGSIQGPPVFTSVNILNGASQLAGPISQNTWVTIKGSGLSPTTGTWKVTGPELPTQVNGVGVTVAGTAVPVSFVSNSQINFLVQNAGGLGSAAIQVTSNGLTSATVQATMTSLSPGFFPLGTQNGKSYIAATHADGSLLGPAGLVAGATTTPAKAGETIVLYGTGFGATISGQPALPVNPVIVIDGIVADVKFAGLTGPGLYQFNVTVPATASVGDDLVVALLVNSETQAAIYLSVGQ
ncbi:MAG: TIGR03118 family protein, partial [Acidobacteriia bacterium]|nr:TIGR03118 family protein [Terriglobia bacterium]